MASFSPTWLYPESVWQVKVRLNYFPKRYPLLPYIKCENTEKNEGSFEHVSVERPPYHSYMDSISGQLEPASGVRASIPGEGYWPEGTSSRVRAANAPEPTGESAGSPFGKSPGSLRKMYKASVAAPKTSEMSIIFNNEMEAESLSDVSEDPKDLSSEFVVYQTEPKEEELTGYELDKKLGRCHPFIDPKVKKTIQEPFTSEELWWNWRKPDKEQWSRWQRRRPNVETVFRKAMAETGKIKLYGEHPTVNETSLYRARRHLHKDEVWGGDPVYPSVSYIQDPDEVIDYRGPDFHYPTPNMLSYLKEHGKIISREELDKILAKEKTEQLEITDNDEAVAKAIDIGENDDEGEDSEAESNEEEEKITRSWSVLKSTPQLRKTKEKPKKDGLSLDEAIDDSENLTDFIMDFEEDE